MRVIEELWSLKGPRGAFTPSVTKRTLRLRTYFSENQSFYFLYEVKTIFKKKKKEM